MTPVTAVTPAALPGRVGAPDSRAAGANGRGEAPSSHEIASAARSAIADPHTRASEDEILGIDPPGRKLRREGDEFPLDGVATDDDGANQNVAADDDNVAATRGSDAEPENLRAVFDANPELRAAWQDASAYREAFATPQAAREATALLADVNRMDALFFSRRPEDHAALARAIADLDPASFESLARAIGEFARTNNSNVARVFRPEASAHDAHATRKTRNPHASPDPDANSTRAPGTTNESSNEWSNESLNKSPSANGRAVPDSDVTNRESRSPAHESSAASRENHTAAQTEFFHATNASAVQGVVAAIESQVERLLPEGIAKGARARVVSEIYRELDSNLRSNRQLASQMRDAFRSGSLDAEHQRAIVSLITSRARQALPGVAKRVLNEWTSTLVNANQERRTRQRTAERRIDIAGSSGAGNDGRRSMSPGDLDYSRLSDADILNL